MFTGGFHIALISFKLCIQYLQVIALMLESFLQINTNYNN